jgi:hypothetical protein
MAAGFKRSKKMYNFEKFNARETSKGIAKMDVGEVVVRKKNKGTVGNVRQAIKKAMCLGMEFSIAVTDDDVAVRRDK